MIFPLLSAFVSVIVHSPCVHATPFRFTNTIPRGVLLASFSFSYYSATVGQSFIHTLHWSLGISGFGAFIEFSGEEGKPCLVFETAEVRNEEECAITRTVGEELALHINGRDGNVIGVTFALVDGGVAKYRQLVITIAGKLLRLMR
jgi:hypothetical protein